MDIVSSGLNIDAGKLYAYAVSTARLLSVDGTCSASAERRRLREEMRTLRRRYRELAKRNHHSSLLAQGLPEEMVGKATERMSRINAAWETIKEARGI